MAAILNGRLPASALVRLGWPEADHLYLTPLAAAWLNLLAAAFETHFGKPLYLSDAYRTYAQQVTLKALKGKFAATPGTSNHGWGVAIDAASRVNVDGSAEHRWFEANAPLYGWINPAWAVDYDSNNGEHEPWHWEFKGAPTKIPAPTTQEDDMPLNSTDIDAVGERIKEILRAPEFQGYSRDNWAGHLIEAAGLGPAPTDVWIQDTRLGVLDIANYIHGLAAQVGALQGAITALAGGQGADPAAITAAAEAGARAALAGLVLRADTT